MLTCRLFHVFSFSFFVAFLWNCPFFSCGKKGHQKNKFVFKYQFVGFSAQPNCSNRFFLPFRMSGCLLPLSLSKSSASSYRCRFFHLARIWFRSLQKKKSLVRIVFSVNEYNAYKMSNTCSSYGHSRIENFGSEVRFTALASAKMKTATIYIVYTAIHAEHRYQLFGYL